MLLLGGVSAGGAATVDFIQQVNINDKRRNVAALFTASKQKIRKNIRLSTKLTMYLWAMCGLLAARFGGRMLEVANSQIRSQGFIYTSLGAMECARGTSFLLPLYYQISYCRRSPCARLFTRQFSKVFFIPAIVFNSC